MALAKDITVQDSQIGFLQSCSIYSNVYGEITGPSPVDFFSLENQKLVQEEGECSGDLKFSSSFNYPPVLDYSLNSGVFAFQNSNSDLNHWVYSSGSILNFEQEARLPHSIRPDSIGKNGYRLAEDQNCLETATDSNLLDNKHGEKLKWLDSGSRVGDCLLSFGKELECNFVNKRAYMDGENTNNVQVPKKQCSTVHRKPKLKPIPSKDPQSIAAKNRRERISERLKILQDLVPNGTKVDLVTMLEKAISYVKFLQLQVKVLATDEFWPVQGGKAPEITQVKEAMDAILSSHIRTRNEKEAPNQ